MPPPPRKKKSSAKKVVYGVISFVFGFPFCSSNIDPAQFLPTDPVSKSPYITSSICPAHSGLMPAFLSCFEAPTTQTSSVCRAAWERRGETVSPSLQTACWGSKCYPGLNSLTHVVLPSSCVSVDLLAGFVMFTLPNICHVGHGSEPNWADEHSKQNHWKA